MYAFERSMLHMTTHIREPPTDSGSYQQDDTLPNLIPTSAIAKDKLIELPLRKDRPKKDSLKARKRSIGSGATRDELA